MAGKEKTPVIDLESDLWIGQAQIRRCNENTFRRTARITPMEHRARAQPAPDLSPQLLGNESPKMRGIAPRIRQMRYLFLTRFHPTAKILDDSTSCAKGN